VDARTAAATWFEGAEDAVGDVAVGAVRREVGERVAGRGGRDLQAAVHQRCDDGTRAARQVGEGSSADLAQYAAEALAEAARCAADRAADRGALEGFLVETIAVSGQDLAALDARVETDHEAGADDGVGRDLHGDLAQHVREADLHHLLREGAQQRTDAYARGGDDRRREGCSGHGENQAGEGRGQDRQHADDHDLGLLDVGAAVLQRLRQLVRAVLHLSGRVG
jgi:hypothetical protein